MTLVKKRDLFQSGIDPEGRKGARVTAQDIAALERRAAELPRVPGVGRARVVALSRAAYALRLDFLRHGLTGDFTTWLSEKSGLARTTCYRYWKAGRALAAGSKPTRNQSGLLAEQRERETTPVPDLDWDDDE
ncbi:hypothetical protein L1280_002801 [Deinococcus sp. HSC-46F16]|uniref:hypothetical protein n=1 Tax=Deinococcus sp. HSC-46F16 TaxID=2910968 RepID=UPI00209DD718|nr:hypothetical protein [Deinococcus sp. HSC-46F16]MCP2015633.1 hypothetical protein [Deinococcus sp. HSC-46F16]